MSYKEYIERSEESTNLLLVGLTTLNIMGAIIFLVWMQFDKSEALRTWKYFGWIMPWVTIPINVLLGLACLLGLHQPSDVDELIIRGEEIMREQGKL